MAAAAVTAVTAAISLHPLLSKPSSAVRRRSSRFPFFLLRATSSLPTPPASNVQFNITFGEPSASKTLVPAATAATAAASGPRFLIPWIVHGEDGKLCLRTSPPPHILRAMALEEVDAKKAKRNQQKNKKGDAVATPNAMAKDKKTTVSSQPKFSKAARRFYNENFREPQRLAKVLAAAGVASRRSSEELIFQGKVTVNGSVCTSPQTRVDLAKDSVYVKGNRISKKLPPKLYFALNKPKGYICSCGEESKSVISLFDDYLKAWNKIQPGVPKPRLFTVGRLDVATTGLIIITNDGEFAQKLSHPSSNVSKEYIATVNGTVHKRHLTAISEGTEIDGVKCVPDLVELLPLQPDTIRPRLKIVVALPEDDMPVVQSRMDLVHEGRNHEVRELVQSAGLQVYALKRVRIGKLRLPSDLGIGKYAELKQADIKSLGGSVRSNT